MQSTPFQPLCYKPAMPTLLPEVARAMNAKRIRKGPRNARSLIIELQDHLLKDIRNKKTSAAVRAKCVIAYDKLEDRLRVLAGKPLPGHLQPGLKPKARKGPAALPLPEVAVAAGE